MGTRHLSDLNISNQLSLPADAITQTTIVYGGKGMGKTALATVIAEECASTGGRFAIIDPMGVFWGLRHSADGKGRGFDVLILGGKHGDIPIEPTAGAVVADLVADEEVNVIIDISRKPDGTMWGVGERIRFVADYCTRLYQRQGERTRPILQIIDEAGRFCPQIIPHGSPDVARCVGAVERMVEEGRNVGIGVLLITQRSARMNKSVSELADCMIAFRTVGPRSIDAILDWFGEHVEKSHWKELIEKLRSLPRGTALVVSPGWLKYEGIAAIRPRSTFDSSATPKLGQERKAAGKGAKPDLKPYLTRMAETIEKAKADDPKALRKQVADLQRALAAKSAEPVVLKPAKPAVDAEELKELRRLVSVVASYENFIKKLGREKDTVLKAVESLGATLESGVALKANSAVAGATMTGNAYQDAHHTPVYGKRPAPPVRPAPVVIPSGDGSLRDGARRMLAALAQWFPAGMPEGRLRSHAGLKKSGTYSTYKSDLIRNGYIHKAGDELYATQAGVDFFGGSLPDAPNTTAEVLAIWNPKLREGARRMLEVLIGYGGEYIERDRLFAESGLTKSGTASTYMSDLKRAQLIITNGQDVAANSETLFL